TPPPRAIASYRTGGCRAPVRKLCGLPVLGGGAGAAPDGAGHLGSLEYRLHGNTARALQRQPDRLCLPPGRAEPVIAVRVLEMQEHADRTVLPDEPARLDQDPLVLPQVADE